MNKKIIILGVEKRIKINRNYYLLFQRMMDQVIDKVN
jgi:hypothetical protein